MNESFAQNMTGQTIAFDVQPYRSGKGTTTAVVPRRIKVAEFDPEKGRTLVEYEAFDVTVQVAEGREFGGFSCGVPISPARDLAGQTVQLVGVRYGDLLRAVRDARTIVIARCG